MWRSEYHEEKCEHRLDRVMRICRKTQASSVEAKSETEERKLRSINWIPELLDITFFERQGAKSQHGTDQVDSSPFFRRTVADCEGLLIKRLFAVEMIKAVECVSMEDRNDRMDVV